MKTHLALVVAALAAVLTPAHAQEIIAQWNFNGLPDAAAPTPSLGAGAAVLVGGTTGTFASGAGSSDPEAAADSAWNSTGYPTQGQGARTAGVEFAVSTAGFEGVQFRFDTRPSNTGSRHGVVQYSTDGATYVDGASFTQAGGSVWTNLVTLDLSGVAAARDNAALRFRIVSDFAPGTSEYAAAADGSTYGPNGTWRFDMVTVLGVPIGGPPTAPQIVTPPQSQSRTAGGTATFSVVATGTPPLFYQWLFGPNPLGAQTNGTLTLTNISAANAGEYRVVVSNAVDSVTSAAATLTVMDQPPTVTAVSIAYLRGTVDPVNLRPTNTTQIFQTEGIVTTWVNLTTAANALFYIQDADAGIAVFYGGASNAVPPAGARVRVTGPLGHFNGLLQFNLSASSLEHSVVTLSTGDPLPAPRLTSPSELLNLDPAVVDREYEGRLLTFNDVTVDLANPNFGSGVNETIFDQALTPYTLRIDARTDIVGQPKPRTPFAIVGVLSQFDGSDPRNSAWQILPSRFADILTPSKAPSVRATNFLSQLVRPGDAPTNTFREQSLRPGERLRIEAQISDPEGRFYQLAVVDPGALPPGAAWTLPPAPANPLGHTGTNVAVFEMTARAGDAGKLVLPALAAWNETGTNIASWKVYLPTAAEQRLVLMEYLANPATSTNSPIFNPLRRDPALTNSSTISQADEYLELANLSGEEISLFGWRMADAVQVRHVFFEPATVGVSNAFILYGGPLNGFLPNLDVPSLSSSEGALALNNDGDTIALYNADTNLVFRVVYSAALVTSDASFTRHPDLNGAFAAQSAVSTNLVTPGRQFDGRLFSEPGVVPPADIVVSGSLLPGGAFGLAWNARPGTAYSVWRTPALGTPFQSIAGGLTFPDTGGQHTDASPPAGAGYYQVRSP
ncbi:MAG: lamin tail domain-containing protein [Limisphaerales bacterium]